MRRAGLALVATALIALACGCGGDDGPGALSQDEFASGLIARDNLTPEAAACVSGYLVGALPDDQLRLVIEPDAAGVLPQVWGRYTQVLLACRFHDDLGVASAPGEGGGP